MGLCHVMGGGERTGRRMKAESNSKDTIVGTPAYMSPEQIYGDVDLDCRSDIYNMGATLYQLVTGQVLFPDLSNDDTLRAHVTQETSAPDPRSIDPSLSSGLVRLLSKMCAKDRSARYGSWEEVLADSRVVQSGGMPAPLPQDCASSVAESRSEQK